MSEFLTTSGISYKIEKIIRDAKEKVVLVSPYLQFSKNFYERLKDAESHNVRIIIIYGKSELKPDEYRLLSSLKKIELYYSENLHAKCYFNESEMVITSMNMYEYSEKNNREMGVYITKNNDFELYAGAERETVSIVNSSESQSLNNSFSTKRYERQPFRFGVLGDEDDQESKDSLISGHCIRCDQRISYDVDRPYCTACYHTWAHFGNSDYEEDYCHSCGKENYSTMNKPECYSCYRSL